MTASRILGEALTPQARALVDVAAAARETADRIETPQAPAGRWQQDPIAAAIKRLSETAWRSDWLPKMMRDALVDLQATLCPDCGGDAWTYRRDPQPGQDDEEACPNMHCRGGLDWRNR